jgi:predicted branched-subunit amino acid permease
VPEKDTSRTEERITFTLAGALAGARRCFPIAISGCGIGLVFGTLAGLALISGMWKGRSNILPWTVAAAVAVAAHHWLPGQSYILLGGLAGSFAGVVRRAL